MDDIDGDHRHDTSNLEGQNGANKMALVQQRRQEDNDDTNAAAQTCSPHSKIPIAHCEKATKNQGGKS